MRVGRKNAAFAHVLPVHYGTGFTKDMGAIEKLSSWDETGRFRAETRCEGASGRLFSVQDQDYFSAY
jgi:hypothetical protein